MKTKGHGTIKKSKAYGAIGTLLLSGVLVAAMGTTAVQADETVENSSATEILASTPQVATESTAATATDSEVSVGDTKTSETEAKVISEDAEAADQSKHGATGGGTGVTDRVTDVYLGSNGFNIQYNQPIADGAKIMFAVWSDKNGQDDLIWYTADSHVKTTAKYTGSYGTYLVHTYGVVRGQMVGLNATSVLVPKPEVKANITKESATTYKVTITDVPIYIDDIQVPTWTEANGQDDLQWYKAEKAADGSYCVVFSEATHNLEAGTYNVHVYGYNHVKKVQTGLLGKRFESDYRFGDVAVKAELAPTGIYITMPSDVSSNLKTYHAVWSAKNDQDDIKWY